MPATFDLAWGRVARGSNPASPRHHCVDSISSEDKVSGRGDPTVSEDTSDHTPNKGIVEQVDYPLPPPGLHSDDESSDLAVPETAVIPDTSVSPTQVVRVRQAAVTPPCETMGTPAPVVESANSTIAVPSQNITEGDVDRLLEIGDGRWNREMVFRALTACYNSAELAIDLLYSGIFEQVDASDAADIPGPSGKDSGSAGSTGWKATPVKDKVLGNSGSIISKETPNKDKDSGGAVSTDLKATPIKDKVLSNEGSIVTKHTPNKGKDSGSAGSTGWKSTPVKDKVLSNAGSVVTKHTPNKSGLTQTAIVPLAPITPASQAPGNIDNEVDAQAIPTTEPVHAPATTTRRRLFVERYSLPYCSQHRQESKPANSFKDNIKRLQGPISPFPMIDVSAALPAIEVPLASNPLEDAAQIIAEKIKKEVASDERTPRKKLSKMGRSRTFVANLDTARVFFEQQEEDEDAEVEEQND